MILTSTKLRPGTGGTGVVMDDIVAGVMANLILRVGLLVRVEGLPRAPGGAADQDGVASQVA